MQLAAVVDHVGRRQQERQHAGGRQHGARVVVDAIFGIDERHRDQAADAAGADPDRPAVVPVAHAVGFVRQPLVDPFEAHPTVGGGQRRRRADRRPTVGLRARERRRQQHRQRALRGRMRARRPLVRAPTRFTFPLCQPRAQLRRRSATFPRESAPRRRPASSCARRWTTFARGSTARARRSRRSPSGSPRPGGRACRSSRRRADAPRRAPGARRRSPTRPDRGAGSRAPPSAKRKRASTRALKREALDRFAPRARRAEPQREGAPESRLARQRQEAGGRHEGDAASAFGRRKRARLAQAQR